MKPQGINHALPITLLYLVIHTNHFLQALEDDAESTQLNVTKSRGRRRRTVSQLGWVQTALGGPALDVPKPSHTSGWKAWSGGWLGSEMWLIL